MDLSLSGWGLALGALVLVLGLLWALARAARLAGLAAPAGAGRRVRIAEVTPIDARRRLLLVRVDGREVLLLTGGAQDSVVGWLP